MEIESTTLWNVSGLVNHQGVVCVCVCMYVSVHKCLMSVLMVGLCWWHRSAFFCFCNEERPKVKAKYPSYTVGDIAKELGKRWEACTNRTKFEQLAAKDKQRYEKVSSFSNHSFVLDQNCSVEENTAIKNCVKS